MKIHFVGCVEIGYTLLSGILEAGWCVDKIWTLDKDKGATTSGYIDFEPIATQYNLALRRVTSINKPEYIDEIKNDKPDLIIVCGWQRLICNEILAVPQKGSIGLHSSMLPKYRGRAPVNWAIIMGEKVTGMTMFYLEEEADVGDILGQKAFPITDSDDCQTVYEKSASVALDILLEALPTIENNTIKPIHNPSKSYPLYPKRTPEDGIIDFIRPSRDVFNWIRALTKPYPGAFFFDDNGRKIMVWKSKIGKDESITDAIIKETLDGYITITDWEYGEKE